MGVNILLDPLPETVEVDGRAVPVNTDFRTFIQFEQILQRPDIDNRSKVMQWLELCFGSYVPTDIKGAVDKLLELYRCGKPAKKQAKTLKNGNVEIKPKMIYDYDFDAPYIYGAFMSQYGIDLNDIEYLHWWKFHALFSSLNSSNKIVEIMGYRAAELDKIGDKKERARIARLKQIFAIPDAQTTEEKVARAGMVFGGAFM